MRKSTTPMTDQPTSELHARIREKKILLGFSTETGAASVAELGGLLGFDISWLDLEHFNADWHQAQAFCTASERGGAIPMLRIPAAERNYVMHGLETGAKIIIVP